jgi:hypothetical protein
MSTVETPEVGEACDACKALFINPLLFGEISLSTREKAINYRRCRKGLEVGAKSGCPMCRKLFFWFRLDSNMWDGFDLSEGKKYEDEVATIDGARENCSDHATSGDRVLFHISMVQVRAHTLMIWIPSAINANDNRNYLAVEVHAAAGRL